MQVLTKRVPTTKMRLNCNVLRSHNTSERTFLPLHTNTANTHESNAGNEIRGTRTKKTNCSGVVLTPVKRGRRKTSLVSSKISIVRTVSRWCVDKLSCIMYRYLSAHWKCFHKAETDLAKYQVPDERNRIIVPAQRNHIHLGFLNCELLETIVPGIRKWKTVAELTAEWSRLRARNTKSMTLHTVPDATWADDGLVPDSAPLLPGKGLKTVQILPRTRQTVIWRSSNLSRDTEPHRNFVPDAKVPTPRKMATPFVEQRQTTSQTYKRGAGKMTKLRMTGRKQRSLSSLTKLSLGLAEWTIHNNAFRITSTFSFITSQCQPLLPGKAPVLLSRCLHQYEPANSRRSRI